MRWLKVAKSGRNTEALVQCSTPLRYFTRQMQDCKVAVYLPAVGESKLQPYSMIGRTAAVEGNGFETFAAQQSAIPARAFGNQEDGEYLESGHYAVSRIPSRAPPHTCLLCYRYTICWVRTISLFSKVPHPNLIAGTHQHNMVHICAIHVRRLALLSTFRCSSALLSNAKAKLNTVTSKNSRETH